MQSENPASGPRGLAAVLGFSLAAGLVGYLSWSPGRNGTPEPTSWLAAGEVSGGSPARSVPATGTDEASQERRMPDFTLTSVEGRDVQLFEEGVAPAVVTEFLIGCPDCQPAFRLFPTLAEQIRAAEQRCVNIAYMGNPRRIQQTFRDVDFAGPVHIDKGSRLQRHFGIGTFTVWLLAEDGRILHQGSPAQVQPHLAAHLELRARAAGDRGERSEEKPGR